MDIAAFILASVLTVCMLDRLRQITWKTVHPREVVKYIAYVCWPAGVAYDAFTGGVRFYEFFGLLGQFAWLVGTMEDWQEGVPNHITKPMELQ